MNRVGFLLAVTFLLSSGSQSIAFGEPVPVAASESPDPCASAVPSLPNDLATAFAYDLDSPTILHFISALAAVPAKERRAVFESAVAAAATAPEREVVAAESADCPTLVEMYGASRATYLVVNQWQLREFGDAKRFDRFSTVVAAAVSALAIPSRLTPDQRQTAMLPFAAILAEAASSLAPSESGNCSKPNSPARTRTIVEPVYPPMAVSAGMGGAVRVKVFITETGDVRYVRVASDTLNGPNGWDDVIRATVYSAAATTYWPKIEDCKPISGTYLFEADFHRK